MLRKTKVKTTTYETGHEDFMIDVVEYENDYDEAWLYRKIETRKKFVYGVHRQISTMERFLDRVEELLPKYIELYEEEDDR